MSARNSSDKKALKKYLFDKIKCRGYVPCAYCHRKLTFSQATLDHVIPLAKGGSWVRENLTFACRKCNEAKGAMAQNSFCSR